MKILVTGGGGFLGGAVVRQLCARGDEVVSFSRSHYPELSALGVEHRQGNLADDASVCAAAEGCDAVIHTAAKAGVWGDPESYRRANVLGTRHILSACRAHAIRRLVYTSTPSVVHVGGDIEGADESLPYAEHFQTPYQATKTEAEREVLSANDASLATVALRPHLIWGPGDPHLVPRIVSRGKRGALALPDGGQKKIDTIYVDNAASAHVAALDHLEPGAACAGRAYFITNGEPVPACEIMLGILEAAGIQAKVIAVPTPLVKQAGAMMEGLFRLLPTDREPPVTRFVAAQLSTAHYFDISAAYRDFGWRPEIGLQEGLRYLKEHFARA